MLQRIRKREFSNCVLNGGDARLKVFAGATLDKINYYLVPELVENNYKKVVIHCGTNDLHSSSAEDIVRKYAVIYDTCREYGVETVMFSSVVIRKCRRDIEEKRVTVNQLLEVMCSTEWAEHACFINNSNILYIDLYTDALHLVETGSAKLANNILMCVNNCTK